MTLAELYAQNARQCTNAAERADNPVHRVMLLRVACAVAGSGRIYAFDCRRATTRHAGPLTASACRRSKSKGRTPSGWLKALLRVRA